MRRCLWLCLLALLLPVVAVAAELVNNPNSARDWQFFVDNNATATLREEQGALRFDVTRIVAGQPWCVQLFQPGKHVPEGAAYTIRFMAKASTNRSLGVNCQLDKAPYSSVIGQPLTVKLTPQWQPYSLPVTFRGTGSNTLAIPHFSLGETTGTVWLKDVSVSDTAARTNTTQQPASIPATEPAGELLTDPMKASSWQFECQPDARATLASDAGVLRIEVQQTGSEPWHIQMFQVPPAMAAGSYTCAIVTRASAPRKLTFAVEHNVPPYEKPVPPAEFSIGTEWKEYRIRFTLKSVFPKETRAPLLQLGNAAGTVWIRSISLTQTPAEAR